MSVTKLEPAFSIGEVSPDLFGRFDLARLDVAASTMRNMFVKFTGAATSRAGTEFVGFSKQTGRAYPPRMIPFQFSINQGLALEFGHQYMRVIQDGAFVTEAAIAISDISNTDPAVVTSSGSGVTAATPVTTGVVTTYVQGELVTLAGGTYLTPAILNVTNTRLVSTIATQNTTSTNYVPADTVTLSGGTFSVAAVVTVNTTRVSSATVAAGGAGGTDGTQTVTGTTGTGTLFTASVTVAGGTITAVLSITTGGSYTVNPTVLANEPVTGASLVGAQLALSMGVNTVTVLTAGVFSVNPTSGIFTQSATSGTGTGATFEQSVLGPNAVTISDPGVYTVVPANPVAQASSSGSGLGATFTLTTASVDAFNDGDWVFITGVGGMTEVNGEVYVVDNSTSTTFELFDVYGNAIDATGFGAYTSGGTVARIYTAVSPYNEEDLDFLKWAQSRDVMSLCLVNQDTLVEYAPYELTRNSNTDWTFTVMDPEPTVEPPTNLAGSASAGGSTYYAYVVTSVNEEDGSESIASDIININAAVNIAATAGAINLSWTPAPGVSQQNVYKAQPGFNSAPPPGSQFGFAGYAFGAQFQDSNITADFSQVPPIYKNPFARGQILGARSLTGGTGYTTATASITTGTGSGASLEPIIVGGSVVAFILESPGENYIDADTVTITGDGTGATALLLVGAESGTYPGVVAYFQQRRVYGYTLNEPDTYFMSQPGAFLNFDSRIPTIDSDSIIGSPWSQQVNGIQWLIPMPGGLVCLTGLQAWQLTGQGGSSLTPQPITPGGQQAQPQAFNGAHSHIPPIVIDYDILYVQSKGAIVRDLAYQIATNIYTGTDLTLNSQHLFLGFSALSEIPTDYQATQLIQWAWCEEPYKTIWAVRGDGTMLCLTFMKPQEVAGWSRHDTNGLFQSVCSVTEPPVDALYMAVKRYPGSNTAYMIERMNNRIWKSLDDCWCVDCGIALDQPTPNATLTVDTATGLGAISGYTSLVGGTGYSSGTTFTVVDYNGEGPGTGAVITGTIVNGVITALVVSVAGTGYISPKLEIYDPANTGTGASATLTLDNTATFTASASIFTIANEGDIIRMGGGIATITNYVSGTVVEANITSPIIDIRPNSGGLVNPQVSGTWTLTTPVSTISGLTYLAGATVTGVADGVEIEPTVVPANGVISLPQASTNVVVGLGFTAQLQSVYLDAGEPTIQGRRKKVAEVVARVKQSSNFQTGTNQPDGSTFSPMQIAPAWNGMVDVEVDSVPPYGSTVQPLYTGDVKISVKGGFDSKGQVALQQTKPFPLEVIALVPFTDEGDTIERKYPRKEKGQ